MKRLLFVIPGLEGGGAEKVLCTLINAMDLSRFDVTVRTFEAVQTQERLKPGIRCRAIDPCRTKLGKRLFHPVLRLLAELKLAYPIFLRGDYDVEIAYLEMGATKLVAQSTNRRAAKLAWVHCDLTKKHLSPSTLRRMKRQYARFDRVICVSEDARRGFAELFGSGIPTQVIRNVIDEEEILRKAEAFSPDSGEERLRLTAVGRLAPEKDYSRLIDCCAALRSRGFRFRLDILGEGPERERLERKIRELDLSDCVFLQGFAENPYPWIRSADLLVCSSRYEGMSTAVQEALILGTPVVTTPCTGMEELLGSSRYGLIAEDSEDGLLRAMERMLASPALRASYAAAAAERGRTIRKSAAAERCEALFEELSTTKTTIGSQL